MKKVIGGRKRPASRVDRSEKFLKLCFIFIERRYLVFIKRQYLSLIQRQELVSIGRRQPI